MAEYFTKDGDEYKKVSDSLLTQADVDNVVEKRLERERGKFADYDTIKEKAGKVDTITKEFEEKLKGAGTEKSELETKLKNAELQVDKIKIVHEFKLSDELAEFVDGDSADDMRKRAEKLAKGVVGGKLVVNKDGKKGEKSTVTKTLVQGLFGKKSDD